MFRYRLVAFLAGACIMMAEIAAARAIAPHFGTSTVVWTNVIGIILVALAAGYWIGGRIAEARPEPRVLGVILLVAAALLLIPAFATRAIAGSLTATMVHIGSGFLILLLTSFASIVLLFALPVLLLGTVAPFLVKLASVGRSDIGVVAGSLYGWSTIGSLVGTFLPVLVTFPLLGTRRTILLAAVVLVATAALLLKRPRTSGALALAVASTLLIPVSPVSWVFGGTVLADAESPYQYVRIVEHELFADVGTVPRAIVFNEGFGMQSIAVRADDDRVPDRYFTYMAMTPALIASDPVRILMLGNAGGTIATLMERLFPERTLAITGVELDPTVTRLAQAHFPPPREPYRIVHADSRVFVQQERERYDVVVVDAYTNQLTIPPHLVTREFFALVATRLAEGGVLAVNINAPTDDSRLLATLLQTIRDVFPHVELRRAGSNWNRIVYASMRPIASDRIARAGRDARERAMFTAYAQAGATVARDAEVRTFTDDWAPVELFTDAEVFQALRQL